MYDSYDCSNEGAAQMFARIDKSGDNQITVPEIKEAWEYFEGLGCELFG